MLVSARKVKKSERLKASATATSASMPNPVKAAEDLSNLKTKSDELVIDVLTIIALLYTKCQGGSCKKYTAIEDEMCYGCRRQHNFTMFNLHQPFDDRVIHPTVLYNDIFFKQKMYKPLLLTELFSFMTALMQTLELTMRPEQRMNNSPEWQETMHEKRVQAQKLWLEGQADHDKRLNDIVLKETYTDLELLNCLEARAFEGAAILEIVSGKHVGKTWQTIAKEKETKCLTTMIHDWKHDRSPLDSIETRIATAKAWNDSKVEFLKALDECRKAREKEAKDKPTEQAVEKEEEEEVERPGEEDEKEEEEDEEEEDESVEKEEEEDEKEEEVEKPSEVTVEDK
jgi:hypothetical protein